MQSYFGRVAALLLHDKATWKQVIEADTTVTGLCTRRDEGVETREEHRGSKEGGNKSKERTE